MSLRSAHCTVCRLFRYRPPTPAPAPPLLYRRCTAAVAHVLHQGDMYGEDAACPIRPEQMTSEVCCGGGGGGAVVVRWEWCDAVRWGMSAFCCCCCPPDTPDPDIPAWPPLHPLALAPLLYHHTLAHSH